jgi:hypothetical protein
VPVNQLTGIRHFASNTVAVNVRFTHESGHAAVSRMSAGQYGDLKIIRSEFSGGWASALRELCDLSIMASSVPTPSFNREQGHHRGEQINLHYGTRGLDARRHCTGPDAAFASAACAGKANYCRQSGRAEF